MRTRWCRHGSDRRSARAGGPPTQLCPSTTRLEVEMSRTFGAGTVAALAGRCAGTARSPGSRTSLTRPSIGAT